MGRLSGLVGQVLLCVFVAVQAGGCAGMATAGRGGYDVVVYGGTSSGVTAAVQAARMGKSVVLLEPGRHLVGLTSGGLGATDIGNKAAIGGVAREFYHRVYLHYLADESWVYERREQYRNGQKSWRGAAADWDKQQAWWTFEPHVAEAIFNDMVRQAKVPVEYGQRLDLQNGVCRDGGRVVSVRMESGRSSGAGCLSMRRTRET